MRMSYVNIQMQLTFMIMLIFSVIFLLEVWFSCPLFWVEICSVGYCYNISLLMVRCIFESVFVNEK